MKYRCFKSILAPVLLNTAVGQDSQEYTSSQNNQGGGGNNYRTTNPKAHIIIL